MKKLLFIVFLVSTGLFSCVVAYSEEQTNAYKYAYDKGITTINDINKANLNGEITRIAMAKMMSNYAIEVLGLKPDTSLGCAFYDVDPSVNEQYDNGITKICQLGLMGILDDGSISDYFNPYKTVTRGQRATIFSRALNKSRGENVVEGDPFYKPHLLNLHKKGLIQNVKVPNPTSNEKRGNVLIMMYRTDPSNAVTVNYPAGVTKLKAGQIYRNEYYGFEILSTRKHDWVVDVSGGYVSLCNFLDKNYENLTLEGGYEKVFREKAESFGENGLVNCIPGLFSIVKKGGADDINLEKDRGYPDSPIDKIDLNNGNMVLEYPRGRGQEPQYQYKRGKYDELLDLLEFGKDEELYNNVSQIEWTLSMSIYDDFKLQPIQNDSSKLYQILNEEKIDLSKYRDSLDKKYEQMISTKNRLKKWKTEFLIDNPNFNVNTNTAGFKKEMKKMLDERYSSSNIEKLTAYKFFKDEFGVYLRYQEDLDLQYYQQ